MKIFLIEIVESSIASIFGVIVDLITRITFIAAALRLRQVILTESPAM